MTSCPGCGLKYSVNFEPASVAEVMKRAYQERRGHTFESAILKGNSAASLELQPDPNLASRTLEAPARSATVESDVKVPLLQSVIGGAFLGAGIFCAWRAIGWPQPCWGPAALTFSAVGIFWSGGVREMRSLLWRLEEWTGKDITRDSAIGKPQRRGSHIRLVSINGELKQERIEPRQRLGPVIGELIDIPGMPRQDDDPWTIERLEAFLESVLIYGWGRSNYKLLGVSQGQWAALKTHLETFGIWGINDPSALQRFVEQIQGDFNQPTAVEPTNQE